MNNFWQRVVTGIVFIGVIITLTLYSQYTFLGLLMLIGFGALYEYYTIVFNKKMGCMQVLYTLTGVGLITAKYWLEVHYFVFGMPVLFCLTAIVVLLSKEKNWKHIGYLISGLFYVALPLALFYHYSFQPGESQNSTGILYRPELALNLFLLIWCSDSFAYVFGRAFGKHKLFESISPKKTWEGFIGGGLMTIAFSFLLAYCLGLPYGLNVAVAFSTVVFGALGDLVESMLKREFDVKDSGSILPGHGGVLDRFDALLISLPFTTLCYYLAYHIL